MLRFVKGRIVLLTVVMILLVNLGALAAARPGEGVVVRPAKASWLSSEPKSVVISLLLQELGYQVEEPRMFSSNPLAYQAIVQGDIDYWPSGWFPGHTPQVPSNFEREAVLAGTICTGCGIEGYLVDIPSIERFNIKSLDDFKRPEVKQAFDANRDGRADLFGCPPGWGCHEVVEYHLDAYDLRDHVNHVTADYTFNLANAVARIKAGEPTLLYTWAPNNSILLAVPGEDVLWINVPYIDKAPAHEDFEDEALIVEGMEHAVSDPLLMGFVANNIHIVANRRFIEANPAAAELFRQVKLSLEWISEATLRIDEGEDPWAIGREWIEENRETVDQWLEAARQAAE